MTCVHRPVSDEAFIRSSWLIAVVLNAECLRGSWTASGYGVRRIEIRTVVNSDAKSIHELAAQPTADGTNG
jgi:hypothetical protein